MSLKQVVVCDVCKKEGNLVESGWIKVEQQLDGRIITRVVRWDFCSEECFKNSRLDVHPAPINVHKELQSG